MAKNKLKPVIIYTLSFLIAIFLLLYVFKDIDVEDMLLRLQHLDYSWIILSVFLSVISHLARAYRWNILLKPLGYSLNLFPTFLAVMVGYFANIILPRMGEVSKCAVIKRTENIPITSSFGTVVAERVLDFFVLMSLLAITIIIEFSRLKSFLFGFFSFKVSGIGENLFGIYIFTGAIVGGLLLVALFRKNLRNAYTNNLFFQKLGNFWKELAKGLMSIKRIDNKLGFFISTIVIWLMYFLMAYVVVFAIPQTSNLSLMAGLTILVMGGLGMAAPVQGGIGTYHALVSSVLVLYGINEADGVLFATVLHTSQTIFVLVIGGLSLLLVSLSKKVVSH